MQRLLAILLLCLLCLPANATSRFDRVMATSILRCGYIPWPGFFEIDAKTNILKGFYKELTDQILAQIGWKAEYIEVNFGQQVEDLKSGKIDAMCGEGPWMLDVIKYTSFTFPTSYMPIYVFGKVGTPYTNVKDIDAANVIFVGIDGDLSSQLAQRQFPKAKLRTLSNISNAGDLMLEVASGKADFTIIDSISADAFEKNNPQKIRNISGNPLAVYPIGFLVEKGQTELLDTLNGTIEAAHNNRLIEDMINTFDPDKRMIVRVPTVLDSLP